MEDINLHFTGDFHAIGAANNLLAAMLDNHIQQGNQLGIDPRQITWKRAVDMNDRQLRFVVDGLGGKANGTPREDGFDITVASEIMAVLCLSQDIPDLKARLSRIVVGYTYAGKPVTAGDLKATGAMAALLKDALKPNLVQTLEGTPAFVHGGPFANIAHGCNSVMATRMAMALGDIAVTEAGFGADLGAEKFCDIKCRMAGIEPNAVVVVATVKALKMNGGVAKADLAAENLEALEAGLPNLLQHVANMNEVFGMPDGRGDQPPSHRHRGGARARRAPQVRGARCQRRALRGVGRGRRGRHRAGRGGPAPGRSSRASSPSPTPPAPTSPRRSRRSPRRSTMPTASTSPRRRRSSSTPCGRTASATCPCASPRHSTASPTIPAKLGAPRGFRITVREVKVSAGAGFVVALTGAVMTMPGLPKVPAAEKIDVDETGRITGLF